jgi:hypothetical protein
MSFETKWLVNRGAVKNRSTPTSVYSILPKPRPDDVTSIDRLFQRIRYLIRMIGITEAPKQMTEFRKNKYDTSGECAQRSHRGAGKSRRWADRSLSSVLRMQCDWSGKLWRMIFQSRGDRSFVDITNDESVTSPSVRYLIRKIELGAFRRLGGVWCTGPSANFIRIADHPYFVRDPASPVKSGE